MLEVRGLVAGYGGGEVLHGIDLFVNEGEGLIVHGPTWSERNARLGRVYELFPWLKERGGQLARTLSGGERRMLALGRGLMSKARLLLIDEPSLGLAPIITQQIYASIHKVKQGGMSLLIGDENANYVAGLAYRV